MHVDIDFDPQTQARLDALARERGIDAPALIKELVTEHLPTAAAPASDDESRNLIQLLRSWREEDRTDDADELQRRDVETEEMLRNLTANRVSFPTEAD